MAEKNEAVEEKAAKAPAKKAASSTAAAEKKPAAKGTCQGCRRREGSYG